MPGVISVDIAPPVLFVYLICYRWIMVEDKIFQQFVVNVKNNNDIVSTISNYVPVKKSGKNFLTNCPFHLEKTPSFNINPEKQFFYCFGCQAGGDVIKFVSMMENISYKEALIKLAGVQGIELPTGLAGSLAPAETDKFKIIYNLLGEASLYFFKVLASASKEAETARNYLYMRGVKNEDIEQYMLGYSFASPAKFHEAVLKSKKYTASDLEQAGLIVKTADGRYFDRFFGRIVFPIFDRSSRTIGFGGRTTQLEGSPKYLNSPETAVYKKNSAFYGINFAHDAIIKTKEVILVEGYFDFISLHRNGIHNVLATCGTALSPYHVKYIENNVNRVIFLYDMDEAGIRATMKNFELFSKPGLNISVVKFEGAKDADEFVNKYGLEKTGAALSKAMAFTKFLVNYAYDKFGRRDVESKTSIINFLTPHLRSIASEISRNQYITLLAQDLNISEDGIRDIVFKGMKNPAYGGAGKEIDNKLLLAPEANVRRKLEIDLLHSLIQKIDFLPAFLAGVNAETIKSPELLEMIELMLGADNLSLKEDLQSLYLSSEYAPLYNKLLAVALDDENASKYFEDLISKYNNIVRKEQIDDLKLKIREAETVGDIETSKQLLQKVSMLQKDNL
ncbi:MAG: DNA primase [bacterium ADurb.Bin243]|nr:MAG: DNA primase [bacterium ADurb.Bin243]